MVDEKSSEKDTELHTNCMQLSENRYNKKRVVVVDITTTTTSNPTLLSLSQLHTNCMQLHEEPFWTFFSTLNSKDYRNIIYLTLKIGFCCSTLTSKILNIDRFTFLPIINRLQDKELFELIRKEDYKKYNVTLIQRYEELSDYHFRKMRFYRLCESARDFYDPNIIETKISPDIIEKIKMYGSSLSKTHLQVEKERKCAIKKQESKCISEDELYNLYHIHRTRFSHVSNLKWIKEKNIEYLGFEPEKLLISFEERNRKEGPLNVQDKI